MSRIGNRILAIPENVTVEVVENLVKVKGPKGELETSKCKNVNVEVKDGSVYVTRANEEIKTKQMHGTVNANIKNMLEGVVNGYKKSLEIVGVANVNSNFEIES